MLERFLQLACPLLDLALQPLVQVLETAGHLVEPLRQRLDLVAGPDRQAMIEIASADAGRTISQGVDRHHHAPREPQAGQAGQPQCRQQDGNASPERRVEWLERLADRQVDEYVPAERRHRRRGGEHLASRWIAGDGRKCHAAAGGLRRRSRRGNLRQRRQVGLAQDEADVRMSDQQPALVDDVGRTRLADPQSRDDVPDELQVHLRHRHSGAAARAGDAERHVGLRILAEVHLAHVPSLGLRLLELPLAGAIDPAAGDVHRQPRHA